MIDSEQPLETVEKAVRKFLLLRDKDPIVRVMLAGILANFAPDRDVPVWLVIVGDPASAKTDLTSLIQDWGPTWVLPDMLSEAYFFSSKTGRESALKRIAEGGYRMLYSQDMGGMMDINRIYAPAIFQQLRGIHDGFLKKETGFDSRPLLYGTEHASEANNREPVYTSIEPALRLGWLGTATPEFYPWQLRHARLGTRFTCYWFQPFADWMDYQSLTDIEHMRAEKSHWRPVAATAVKSFLDMAIKRFDGFELLQVTELQSNRIASAVKLVNRIIGTRNTTDTGARLHPRITSMCRVMAFMAGKTSVTEAEMKIGLRLAMSQMPTDEHKVIKFTLEHAAGWWPQRECLAAIGLTRRQGSPILEAMVDVGVIEQAPGSGQSGSTFQYAASASTRKLARVFGGREPE